MFCFCFVAIHGKLIPNLKVLGNIHPKGTWHTIGTAGTAVFGPAFNKRYIEDELYFENHPNQKDDRYQMVLSLAVLPEYRKQGVATKLIEAIAQEGRKQNRQAISLTCLPKLIKFYEKRGFYNEGETNDDIPDPTGVTSVNMVRTL